MTFCSMAFFAYIHAVEIQTEDEDNGRSARKGRSLIKYFIKAR